jgi:hypothetical protein
MTPAARRRNTRLRAHRNRVFMRYSRSVRRTDLHPGQSELAGHSASAIPLRIDLPVKRRRHTFGRHEAVDRLAVLGVGLADPGRPSPRRGVCRCAQRRCPLYPSAGRLARTGTSNQVLLGGPSGGNPAVPLMGGQEVTRLDDPGITCRKGVGDLPAVAAAKPAAEDCSWAAGRRYADQRYAELPRENYAGCQPESCRGFVFKQYLPLVKLGESAFGSPLCEEYRLFFWQHRLLMAAPYDRLAGSATDFGR